MIVDGKKIAKDIQQELRNVVAACSTQPRFAIVYVGNDPVIDNFLKIKRRFGDKVGVTTTLHKMSEDTSEEKLIQKIEKVLADKYDGVIIQLPLPQHIDQGKVLNLIPASIDIDVLSQETLQQFFEGTTPYMPTVPGAIKEILDRNNVTLQDKNIVIVGRGRLVGGPLATWMERRGIAHTVVEKETPHKEEIIKKADVLITGAGNPGMITPDMVKEHAIIIDAGTSESSGKVVGDVDECCAEKAALFTPVPGGVGPITVAILYKNLLANCQ